MYERISSFLPRPIIDELRRQFIYNHIYIDERKFAGFMVLFTLLLSAGVSVICQYAFGLNILLTFIASAIGLFATAYLLLRMSSESKGKFVDTILPDALQLIASNMRSGLTTERSLFVAGRPEFGPLQYELRNASKRISSGERTDVALHGIALAINSTVLAKTMWLISRGIKSGGQIADLLFQLADDLKSQQALEEETRSNISIYVLLILFSAVFGAPVLFGISSFIVQILSKQMASAPQIDVDSLPTSSNLSNWCTMRNGCIPALDMYRRKNLKQKF